MSNSFNISVAPEIAAVKADTADIRTDVTAIHDVNLPAVKTDTADVRTDVTAIHDVNLPAVKTDTADIRTDVTAIHDTNLPAVKVDTASIRSDLITIDTVVDAIKLKTDATPQNVRGTFNQYILQTDNAAGQDVCNITGHGTINWIWIHLADAADTVAFRLWIDGIPCTEITHTGDIVHQHIFFSDNFYHDNDFIIQNRPWLSTELNYLNAEFSTSLICQVRRSAGAANIVYCKVCLSLDPF